MHLWLNRAEPCLQLIHLFPEQSELLLILMHKHALLLCSISICTIAVIAAQAKRVCEVCAMDCMAKNKMSVPVSDLLGQFMEAWHYQLTLTCLFELCRSHF